MSRRHPDSEPEPTTAAADPATSSRVTSLAPADPDAGTAVSETGNVVGPTGPGSAGAEEIGTSAGDTSSAESDSAPVSAGPTGRASKAPKQTLAGRVWVALGVAAILLILVIIFIAENTKSITISFLGLHGHISEALALLLAVVVGIIITLLVGSARILQLSLEVRRQKRTVRKLS
jgi:uncharacterized integral membrane protein